VRGLLRCKNVVRGEVQLHIMHGHNAIYFVVAFADEVVIFGKLVLR
jgi:hypothetical protein